MAWEKSDKFNDARWPHMARGDFMFNGFAVVIDPRLEPEYVGDEIKPLWPHPLYCWFMRLFHRPVVPRFIPTRRIEHERILQSADKLFMSPRAWAQLKANSTQET